MREIRVDGNYFDTEYESGVPQTMIFGSALDRICIINPGFQFRAVCGAK